MKQASDGVTFAQMDRLFCRAENECAGGEGVAGIYGSLTGASTAKALQTMVELTDFTRASVLVDAGSGVGRLLMFAKALVGVEVCVGVEFDRIKVAKSRDIIQRGMARLTDLVNRHGSSAQKAAFSAGARVPHIKCANIADVKSLPPGTTHIMTFWKGWGIPTQEILVRLASQCPTLQGITIIDSYVNDPGYLMAKMEGFVVTLVEQFKVSAQGGGQFQAFFYKVARPAGWVAPAAKVAVAEEGSAPDEWDAQPSQYQVAEQQRGNKRHLRKRPVASLIEPSRYNVIARRGRKHALPRVHGAAGSSKKRGNTHSAANVLSNGGAPTQAPQARTALVAAAAEVAVAVEADLSGLGAAEADAEAAEVAVQVVGMGAAAHAVPMQEVRSKGKHSACGVCKHCVHPRWKKACITKRAAEHANALLEIEAVADTAPAANAEVAEAAAQVLSEEACSSAADDAAKSQASIDYGAEDGRGESVDSVASLMAASNRQESFDYGAEDVRQDDGDSATSESELDLSNQQGMNDQVMERPCASDNLVLGKGVAAVAAAALDLIVKSPEAGLTSQQLPLNLHAMTLAQDSQQHMPEKHSADAISTSSMAVVSVSDLPSLQDHSPPSKRRKMQTVHPPHAHRTMLESACMWTPAATVWEGERGQDEPNSSNRPRAASYLKLPVVLGHEEVLPGGGQSALAMSAAVTAAVEESAQPSSMEMARASGFVIETAVNRPASVTSCSVDMRQDDSGSAAFCTNVSGQQGKNGQYEEEPCLGKPFLSEQKTAATAVAEQTIIHVLGLGHAPLQLPSRPEDVQPIQHSHTHAPTMGTGLPVVGQGLPGHSPLACTALHQHSVGPQRAGASKDTASAGGTSKPTTCTCFMAGAIRSSIPLQDHSDPSEQLRMQDPQLPEKHVLQECACLAESAAWAWGHVADGGGTTGNTPPLAATTADSPRSAVLEPVGSCSGSRNSFAESAATAVAATVAATAAATAAAAAVSVAAAFAAAIGKVGGVGEAAAVPPMSPPASMTPKIVRWSRELTDLIPASGAYSLFHSSQQASGAQPGLPVQVIASLGATSPSAAAYNGAVCAYWDEAAPNQGQVYAAAASPFTPLLKQAIYTWTAATSRSSAAAHHVAWQAPEVVNLPVTPDASNIAAAAAVAAAAAAGEAVAIGAAGATLQTPRPLACIGRPTGLGGIFSSSFAPDAAHPPASTPQVQNHWALLPSPTLRTPAAAHETTVRAPSPRPPASLHVTAAPQAQAQAGHVSLLSAPVAGWCGPEMTLAVMGSVCGGDIGLTALQPLQMHCSDPAFAGAPLTQSPPPNLVGKEVALLEAGARPEEVCLAHSPFAQAVRDRHSSEAHACLNSSIILCPTSFAFVPLLPRDPEDTRQTQSPLAGSPACVASVCQAGVHLQPAHITSCLGGPTGQLLHAHNSTLRDVSTSESQDGLLAASDCQDANLYDSYGDDANQHSCLPVSQYRIAQTAEWDRRHAQHVLSQQLLPHVQSQDWAVSKAVNRRERSPEASFIGFSLDGSSGLTLSAEADEDGHREATSMFVDGNVVWANMRRHADVRNGVNPANERELVTAVSECRSAESAGLSSPPLLPILSALWPSSAAADEAKPFKVVTATLEANTASSLAEVQGELLSLNPSAPAGACTAAVTSPLSVMLQIAAAALPAPQSWCAAPILRCVQLPPLDPATYPAHVPLPIISPAGASHLDGPLCSDAVMEAPQPDLPAVTSALAFAKCGVVPRDLPDASRVLTPPPVLFNSADVAPHLLVSVVTPCITHTQASTEDTVPLDVLKTSTLPAMACSGAAQHEGRLGALGVPAEERTTQHTAVPHDSSPGESAVQNQPSAAACAGKVNRQRPQITLQAAPYAVQNHVNLERACVEARGEANARGVLQTNPILGSGLGTGAHVSSLEQILRGVHAAAVASGRASNTRAAARPRTTKAMHEGGSFTG